MFPNLILPGLLAFALSLSTGRASPIDSSQALVARENAPSGLKCGNAPQVTGGDLVRPEDYVLATTLPESGNTNKWFKYQYCTVGTQTYIFYGLGEINPGPAGKKIPFTNVYSAFQQSAIKVNEDLAKRGSDGNVGAGWKFIWTHTNVILDVTVTNGQTLTYGILASALTGMANAALNYNPTNAPMGFTIGDSQWGTIARGYAGVQVDERCYYDITPEKSSPCSDYYDE